MNIRDEIREYDRMWGRGEPKFTGVERRRISNPFACLRDWWHRPITDRLDRVEAVIQPQFYKVGATTEELMASMARSVKIARPRSR